MIFAGDFRQFRAYMPNVVFTTADPSQDPDVGLLPMLALVATREIADEEILLNYRLSNYIARPAWYNPVDAAEDKRRWA